MISISSQTFRKGRLFKTSLFLDLFKKVIHEHLKRERDFKLGDPINMMRKFSKEELKQEIQDFNIIQSCQWLKQSQLTIPLSIIRMFSCTVYRGPVSSSDHIIELCICMYIFYINFFLNLELELHIVISTHKHVRGLTLQSSCSIHMH